MSDGRNNLLERMHIPPASKDKNELRSMLKGEISPSRPEGGIQRELDSRITQYDGGSEQTIHEIQDMLERNPNSESLLDWLAFMMYTNDRLDEAIQLYSRLVELSPECATAHYYMANCYFKMGSRDRAIASWGRTMALSPGGKIGRRALARIEMARNRGTIEDE